MVRNLSQIVDQAVGGLVGDLKDRGLFDDTLIIWMGEFGRTPKFQTIQTGKGVGRDHYARAWSTLMLGGGIKAGQVIGRTDQNGATVEDRPVSAPDFMATVCELFGIDWKKLYDGPGGRTVPLVDKDATPIKELLPS
jgi:arylsulfatase A-like enzyme